jgi:hypothetical protein
MHEQGLYPSPLQACPTPHKRGYRTQGEALAGFWIGPQTGNHRPYRCRCGWWHITSNRWPWGSGPAPPEGP